MTRDIIKTMDSEEISYVDSKDLTEKKDKAIGESWFQKTWERLVRLGLHDTARRIVAMVSTMLLMVLVLLFMNRFFVSRSGQKPSEIGSSSALAAELEELKLLPDFEINQNARSQNAIPRDTEMTTILPERSRSGIIEHVIQPGESIFSISAKYNIRPETLLWSNRYTIGDDPHAMIPGQRLIILPIDGILHRWSAGEGLNGVADFYNVSPEAIVNYPPNGLDMASIGDFAEPNIEPGKLLVIPGGTAAFSDWRTPRITRKEPATAKNVGPGACEGEFDGVIGAEKFTFPVAGDPVLSGFDFQPAANHFGIDLGGAIGDPISAVDNGVVVYAGWNDWGYGEMVVIDHGNGWQSLYAHLATVDVHCGQEVYRGNEIGTMGQTGNAVGPHLHFELRHDEYGRVNPWDFLQEIE
ncbi:MAG TPA: LysM peptidoglycan-binding domain-containing M23 family metallopeptidase [Anaerolineaceae bacterium]|nr:LysM peptidoglycan-binding domain-containing M23 family metallopeptidase [Anaerolineaceae bacterium]